MLFVGNDVIEGITKMQQSPQSGNEGAPPDAKLRMVQEHARLLLQRIDEPTGGGDVLCSDIGPDVV